MLEKRKSAVDKRKPFRTFLTDLSKARDCLSRELLFAKVHGYGFSILVIQSFGGNFIWCSTRIHSRIFVVQHLPVRSIFYNKRN